MFKSVSKFISLTVTIVLIITMSIMLFILQKALQNEEMATAKENIHEMAEHLTKSLMFIMSEGIDDVSPYIEDIKNIGYTREVRVIPSNLIRKNSENEMDQIELTVHNSITPTAYSETFNNEPVIRYVRPIIATDNCIDCHGGNVGDSYGIISMRASVQDVINSINSQRRLFFLLALITIVITLFFIIYLIKKQLINGLLQITGYLKKFALGDISGSIQIDGKYEIKEAAHCFKILQESLINKLVEVENIARGDLTGEIKILSEQDSVGKAMIKMQDRIKNLVEDMKALAESALMGKLEISADASKHEGEYGKIVENVNKMLDAVIHPINEAAEILYKVADKDLSSRMNGYYNGDFAKIKNALNTAINNLDDGLNNVIITSEHVATASEQIDGANQAVAQGATEQAGTLQEVSSNLHELSASSSQNVSGAKEAISLSGSILKTTQQGVKSLQELSDAINKIKVSSDETTTIVKVIDEIAFQTNLLALNAAVEAARAGEAGKGFAVVAEEVRNLALRSAEAAKNTSSLVDEVIQNAGNGVDLNQKVTKDLGEIARQIQHMNEGINEIAYSSREQSEGIEQINQAVIQLNNLTQQNASNAEESAASSNEMANHVMEMQNKVKEFKLSKELVRK